MGTTESVFYEEATGSSPPHDPSQEGSGSPPPMAHQGSATKYPTKEVALPSKSSRSEHGTQHPEAQPPQEQQRPRVMHPRVKPIHRLEGLVMGGPKTGKRSLLQRLQGKDPFLRQGDNDPSEALSSSPSITIPYKPPPVSLSLDRIQLHIQCKQSTDRFEQYYQKQKIHFGVVLVNPNHKLDAILSYLEHVVTIHLDSLDYPSAGNSRVCSTNAGGKEERISKIERDRCGDENPVCICFLFNFRDLSKENFSMRSELQSSVDEILQERNVPKEKIVIEWIDMSLRNCYGLDLLHAFIYKTYLLRKEAELQKQLRAVQNQLRITLNLDKALTTYEEFLDVVEPKNDTQHLSLKENGRQGQLVSSKPAEKAVEQSNVGTRQVEAATQRMNLPPSFHQQNGKKFQKKQQQSLSQMGRDALEAFLASSDEEDDNTRNPGIKVRSTSSTSTDDEDDDDFFYDESGQRKYIHQTQQRSLQVSDSSDEDEDAVRQRPSLHTKNQPLKSKSDTRHSVGATTEGSTFEGGNDYSSPKSRNKEIEKDESSSLSPSTNEESAGVKNRDHVDSIHTEQSKSGRTEKRESHKAASESASTSVRGPDDDSQSESCSNEAQEVETDMMKASSTTCRQRTDDNRGKASPNESGADDAELTKSVISSDKVEDDTLVIESIKTSPPNSDAVDADDYMIGSIPNNEEGNDCMISANTTGFNGDDDSDGDDDDYVIGSNPTAHISQNEEKDEEDDDGDEYMIESVPLASTGGHNQHESDENSKHERDNNTPSDQSLDEASSKERDGEQTEMTFCTQAPSQDGDDNCEISETAPSESIEPLDKDFIQDSPDEPHRNPVKASSTDDNGHQNQDNESLPSNPPKGSSMSDAALAAIAAAQREAEVMLLQQQQQYSAEKKRSKEKKSKKKKDPKSKSEKKKKKKKEQSDEG